MPKPPPAGYSGTPLPKKLGIKIGSAVALLGAPDDFARTLGELPYGASLTTRITKNTFLVLWFVRNVAELEKGVDKVAGATPDGGLWICWPKRTSSTPCDLTLLSIRAMVAGYGLVDSKICAVDNTWSGAAITRRRQRSQSKAARRSSGPPMSESI